MKLASLTLFVITSIFLCSCASVPDHSFEEQGIRFERAFPVEVESNNIGTLLYINGIVDGQKVHFLLDTGAFKTGVSSTAFFQKYVSVSSIQVHGIYSAESEDEIKVKSLTLDNVSIPLPTLLRSPPNKYREGILGSDAVMGRVFGLDLFNLNHARLFFIESFPEKLLSNNLRITSNNHILIDADLDGIPIACIFDTGASRTVVNPDLIEKNPDSFQFIGYRQMYDGNGKSVKEKRYYLKRLRLGRLLLKNLEVTTMNNLIRHKNPLDDYSVV